MQDPLEKKLTDLSQRLNNLEKSPIEGREETEYDIGLKEKVEEYQEEE